MDNYKKEIGKIRRVYLAFDVFLVLVIDVDFGTKQQAFCPILSEFDKTKNRVIGTSFGLDLIIQILDLFQVDILEKIVGRTVYVLRSSEDSYYSIVGFELPEFEFNKRLLLEDVKKEWNIK